MIAEGRPSPSPPPIVNSRAIVPWLASAATGRADVVCLGDSNQLLGNTGWDHGWIKGLSERFGLYATGLLAPGEGQGNSSGSGYLYSVSSTVSSGQFQYSGAPPVLDAYMSPSVGMSPFNYLYVPAGAQAGAFATHGLFLDRFAGVDVNGPLRFHLVIGTFEVLGGSFRLSVRRATSPFTTYLDGEAMGTWEESSGALGVWLDLPADTREAALNMRFSPWGEAITGPFIAYYVRAENLARPVGVSLHTLYAAGGQSARDMAAALFAADDSYLTLFFSKVRERQGGSPRVLVRVNAGLNDRGETLPSVLQGLTPGNSPEAFADNLRAIMARVRAVWAMNLWPEEELSFLFTASHPISNPDDASLEAYRAAAAGVADGSPRAAAVNFGALTAWGEMVANGWYQLGGFDTHHLTQAGYEALSAREIAALEDGGCFRDLNGDRALDVEDLYEWHRLRPDLTGDGESDYADARCVGRALRALEFDDMVTARIPIALPDRIVERGR